MYSTHCTSVKITLKIRAVKIFVFVCKVAAKKNAGNIKSVCCKQNMSRERAKRSVFFFTGCALLLSISECNAATRYWNIQTVFTPLFRGIQFKYIFMTFFRRYILVSMRVGVFFPALSFSPRNNFLIMNFIDEMFVERKNWFSGVDIWSDNFDSSWFKQSWASN